MNAALRNLVLATVVTGLAGVSSEALAQGRAELRLYPGPVAPENPRLGFHGHFEWGYGMAVDSVVWGTPAARIGLEGGDVILAINGHRLRSEWDYHRLLRASGGYVRLAIQDWRTGAVVARTAYLEGGSYYRSRSVAAGSRERGLRMLDESMQQAAY